MGKSFEGLREMLKEILWSLDDEIPAYLRKAGIPEEFILGLDTARVAEVIARYDIYNDDVMTRELESSIHELTGLRTWMAKGMAKEMEPSLDLEQGTAL